MRCGVEPVVETIVTSAAGSPFSRAADTAANTSLFTSDDYSEGGRGRKGRRGRRAGWAGGESETEIAVFSTVPPLPPFLPLLPGVYTDAAFTSGPAWTSGSGRDAARHTSRTLSIRPVPQSDITVCRPSIL